MSPDYDSQKKFIIFTAATQSGRALMKHKSFYFSCLAIVFLTISSYSQCLQTPQTSVVGTRCITNELRVVSNVLPGAVTWELNGSVISTQTVSLYTSAVTVAGGKGAGVSPDQLNNPDRIFVDAAGVMYIPDLNNHRVQKWLPGAASGITVAGGNGAGTAANQLNKPSGVFVDLQGNVYVVEQANARVQKWSPGATSGITVAGGAHGNLTLPTDIFVDKTGNLYVSDQSENVVKKWAPGATSFQVVAGDYRYGSDLTSLHSPTGIALDDAGNKKKSIREAPF